jgi:hypothetical protein
MKQSLYLFALMAAMAATAAAQTASQPDPYQGTSNPPPDDTIVTSDATPLPKPSPAKLACPAPASAPVVAATPAPPPPPPATASSQTDGTDDGIVQVASEPVAQGAPALSHRGEFTDPDGDIVHPASLGPNDLGEGTTIRVRLLQRLSSADAEKGNRFRTRVASDVVQGGQVLIPAGAEIDGSIAESSSGHFGGHGFLRLRPETVILADGSRYRLYAQTMAAPGSGSRVVGEGTILPKSRVKKDEIEYAGAVGGGAITGAVLGGPGGALAGSIVGASVITVHLMVSHPQTDLEPGTVLIFSLTEPLHLAPMTNNGN